MVESYLSDIVKVDSRKWTREQWATLGTHHAQALVARHLRSMAPREWASFRAGVMAGAQHEYERTAGTRENRYWWAFIWKMEAMPDKVGPVWAEPALRRVV